MIFWTIGNFKSVGSVTNASQQLKRFALITAFS
jgi:hypothetical protein